MASRHCLTIDGSLSKMRDMYSLVTPSGTHVQQQLTLDGEGEGEGDETGDVCALSTASHSLSSPPSSSSNRQIVVQSSNSLQIVFKW